MLTVALSLLYLEDAALKLPHTRLQAAPYLLATPHPLTFTPRPPESPSKQGVEQKVELMERQAEVARQQWPDHKKDPRRAALASRGTGVGGGTGMGSPQEDGGDMKVLNSLEIVVQNLTHVHGYNQPQKESERLGVVYKDGAVIIPPYLLSASPPSPPLPSRQRYIIYLCTGNITCCGWGDRQHGILSAYLISLVTNRTFGVDMSMPCPLTTLFHPRIIDWKLNSSALQGLTSRHIYSVNDWIFRQVSGGCVGGWVGGCMCVCVCMCACVCVCVCLQGRGGGDVCVCVC